MLDPVPAYLDCPSCGTSVASHALERHRCDDRHCRDHSARIARAEALTFEVEFCRFLATPQGRFEVFYAARSRAS
jgi:hypothetical protein